MNNCLKCGKEMKRSTKEFVSTPKENTETLDLPIWLCECGNWITLIGMEECQQELEEVLSKFIKVGRGRLWNRIDVRIFYNEEYKTFALNHELNIISIKTVKSILEDLEEKKNE